MIRMSCCIYVNLYLTIVLISKNKNMDLTHKNLTIFRSLNRSRFNVASEYLFMFRTNCCMYYNFLFNCLTINILSCKAKVIINFSTEGYNFSQLCYLQLKVLRQTEVGRLQISLHSKSVNFKLFRYTSLFK
jgi:hypothetical protein